MSGSSSADFNWFSPLGLSVALFLLTGLLDVLIGVLTPLLLDRWTGPRDLIISTRTDAIVFGQPPGELLQTDPQLARLRTILIIILGGFILLTGLYVIAIAWFGLRHGQPWALAALALGGLAVLPYWLLALRPYLQPGVNLTLFDVPPFMWVPAALLLPAVIWGWIGLT